MDLTVPKDWKQVSPELFNEFLTVCDDYRSEGWANGIAYYFSRNKDRFGFQVDFAGASTFWLDPKFLA